MSNVARAILDLIDQQINLGEQRAPDRPGTVNYAYLYYEDQLGKDLHAKLGDSSIWMRHQDGIRAIANAPYVTALPDVIAANPVYHDKHAQSVDLWRNRVVTELSPLGTPYEINLNVGLDTFVRGLALLSIDDILELRQSKIYADYMRVLHEFDGTDEQVDSLKGSYIAYQAEIEKRVLGALETRGHRAADSLKVHTHWANTRKCSASWFVQKVMGHAIGSQLASGVGLLKTMLRPNEASDPRNPGRLAAHEERFSLEQARKWMIEQEAKKPAGRVESVKTIIGPACRDTLVGASR